MDYLNSYLDLLVQKYGRREVEKQQEEYEKWLETQPYEFYWENSEGVHKFPRHLLFVRRYQNCLKYCRVMADSYREPITLLSVNHKGFVYKKRIIRPTKHKDIND